MCGGVFARNHETICVAAFCSVLLISFFARKHHRAGTVAVTLWEVLESGSVSPLTQLLSSSPA